MICYRFPSQQQFRTLAAAEGLMVAEENGAARLRTDGHGWSLTEVGTIWQGGTWDAQGNQLTPPTALPGWHVNSTGLSPDSWDPWLVVVNTASCTYFGDVPQAPDLATLEAMSA